MKYKQDWTLWRLSRSSNSTRLNRRQDDDGRTACSRDRSIIRGLSGGNHSLAEISILLAYNYRLPRIVKPPRNAIIPYNIGMSVCQMMLARYWEGEWCGASNMTALPPPTVRRYWSARPTRKTSPARAVWLAGAASRVPRPTTTVLGVYSFASLQYYSIALSASSLLALNRYLHYMFLLSRLVPACCRPPPYHPVGLSNLPTIAAVAAASDAVDNFVRWIDGFSAYTESAFGIRCVALTSIAHSRCPLRARTASASTVPV